MSSSEFASDFLLPTNQSDYYDFAPDFLSDDSGGSSPSSDCSSPRSPIRDLDHSLLTYQDEAEERKRRLAHKRDLARENRKRKKDRAVELQQQVLELRAELDRERKRLQPAPLESTPLALTLQPSQPALQAPKPIFPSAPSFTDNPDATLCAYVENLVAKVQEDQLRLSQLQASVLPCLAVQFVQWVLSRNDKFYMDPGSLWFSLFVQEVGASPDQLDQLLLLRKAFLEQPPTTLPGGAESVPLAFDVLRRSLDDATRLFGSFLQVFNSPQLLAFLQWVERFGAVCIKINV